MVKKRRFTQTVGCVFTFLNHQVPYPGTQELLLPLVPYGPHNGGKALYGLLGIAEPVTVVAVTHIIPGTQLR